MNRLPCIVLLALLAAPTCLNCTAGETVWLDTLDVSKAASGWGKTQRNRALGGSPLRIAGEAFDRGIGTHAPGRFVLRLDGAAAAFTARVGVDDEVRGKPDAAKASVVFQVLGDGKVLWESGRMRLGDGPKTVRVDLAGVKQLDLRVTNAGDGLTCDHADWAEAHLVGADPAKVRAIPPPRMPKSKHQPDPEVHGTVDLADLAGAPGAGGEVLEDFSGRPAGSRWGVLRTLRLSLPAFDRGVLFSHFSPGMWPNMCNRAYPHPFTPEPGTIARLQDGGVFLLVRLGGGDYLAVTAMDGPLSQSWFHADLDGNLLVSVGTFGTAPVAGDLPVVAWARADDLYGACHRAMTAALEIPAMEGGARLRSRKPYAGVFRYLGWCSWEQYRGKISEAKLLAVMDRMAGSPVPVRYVLIDMGHTAVQRGAMTSFQPNENFPRGWGPLLARRSPDGVRWMGLWHDFKGFANGIAAENDLPEGLRAHLEPVEGRPGLTVRNDAASARAFYDAFMGSVKEAGFDFVKTDFQSAQLQRLAGRVDNAVQRCARNSQAFEAALHARGLPLINCNWHNPANFLQCRFSNVGRCSIDYSKNNRASAGRHLLQSYANTLWLGQLVWCDHDMFHSSDRYAGRMMARSKALSGGPVYLSDAPEDFVPEAILPLCTADGELLRPIAPAVPLPESAFLDPVTEPAPYRVVAPLAGGAAAVAVYGFRKDGEQTVAEVTPADYATAGGMVQPYRGPWTVPEEGLVLYDWDHRKARRLEGPYRVTLDGLADRLLLLCPIRAGWAVIGRTDKYLSPAAAEVVEATPDCLQLRLLESGPLAIWTASGKPTAEDVTFTQAGGGLYTAEMPVGKRDTKIVIRR